MANTAAIPLSANTATFISVITNVKLEISIEIKTPVGVTSLPNPIEFTYTERKMGATDTIPRWRRAAKLARIAIDEEEIGRFSAQLDSILSFVSQLDDVDVAGVEPMTSVTPMAMKKRSDVVTDGDDAEAVLKNSPQSEDNFYLVPKVIE